MLVDSFAGRATWALLRLCTPLPSRLLSLAHRLHLLSVLSLLTTYEFSLFRGAVVTFESKLLRFRFYRSRCLGGVLDRFHYVLHRRVCRYRPRFHASTVPVHNIIAYSYMFSAWLKLRRTRLLFKSILITCAPCAITTLDQTIHTKLVRRVEHRRTQASSAR